MRSADPLLVIGPSNARMNNRTRLFSFESPVSAPLFDSHRRFQLQPNRFDSTTCISTSTHLFWSAIDCRHRFLTITTHIFRSTTPEICSSLLPMLPGIPVSSANPSGMKDYGRNILVNDGSWDIAWLIRWLERQVQLCQ